MAICDSTYNELREKDVVNICNCRKLGRISDVVIDLRNGKIKGIVLPGARGFNIFKPPEDIFISWKNILRIGNDVILIEVAHKNIGDKEKCGEDDSDCKEEDCDNPFVRKIRSKALKYLCNEDDIEDD